MRTWDFKNIYIIVEQWLRYFRIEIKNGKKPQYDQGSIGLKKNTCSGKFCLVLDKNEVRIN